MNSSMEKMYLSAIMSSSHYTQAPQVFTASAAFLLQASAPT
jgi:hypothetical protein